MTTATSGQGVVTRKVTSFSFNFGSRSFTGTGGHNVLIPKDIQTLHMTLNFSLVVLTNSS